MTEIDDFGRGAGGPEIHSMVPRGIRVSYAKGGTGPTLVLVHGSFSDHISNWGAVWPLLASHFTLYAIARRGRGTTQATTDHSVMDEARDVSALIEEISEPVFLLGHSYGAQVALATAAMMPDHIRKLILYEPPWPEVDQEGMEELEQIAALGDWDGFSVTFFKKLLMVPEAEVEAVRQSDHWPPIVQDAPASMGDIRALARHDFDPKRFRALNIPILLQYGTHSPRELFATDALRENLPDARLEELADQAHEGMTTAPEQYVESVRGFLRD
jgi:pimeloyl-ACP methyl ester carboxylesterase